MIYPLMAFCTHYIDSVVYAHQRYHAARFKGYYIRKPRRITEKGTLRDEALAMLGGGQGNV